MAREERKAAAALRREYAEHTDEGRHRTRDGRRVRRSSQPCSTCQQVGTIERAGADAWCNYCGADQPTTTTEEPES